MNFAVTVVIADNLFTYILSNTFLHPIYRSIGLGSVALSEYDLLEEALEENKSAAGGVGANILPLLQVSECCVI